jgi:hypothetical protein
MYDLFCFIYLFLISRRQPCNFKRRVKGSKEACKKFEEKITLVQDFGRGSKSVLLYVALSSCIWRECATVKFCFLILSPLCIQQLYTQYAVDCSFMVLK